jgi:hypothetical protein
VSLASITSLLHENRVVPKQPLQHLIVTAVPYRLDNSYALNIDYSNDVVSVKDGCHFAPFESAAGPRCGNYAIGQYTTLAV